MSKYTDMIGNPVEEGGLITIKIGGEQVLCRIDSIKPCFEPGPFQGGAKVNLTIPWEIPLMQGQRKIDGFAVPKPEGFDKAES